MGSALAGKDKIVNILQQALRDIATAEELSEGTTEAARLNAELAQAKALVAIAGQLARLNAQIEALNPMGEGIHVQVFKADW